MSSNTTDNKSVTKINELLGNLIASACYDMAIGTGSDPLAICVTEELIQQQVAQFVANNNDELIEVVTKQLKYLEAIDVRRSDPKCGYKLDYIKRAVAEHGYTEDDVAGVVVHASVKCPGFEDAYTEYSFGILMKPERVLNVQGTTSNGIIEIHNTHSELGDVVKKDITTTLNPIPGSVIEQSMSEELLKWMRQKDVKLYWRNLHDEPTKASTTQELLNEWAAYLVVDTNPSYAVDVDYTSDE